MFILPIAASALCLGFFDHSKSNKNPGKIYKRLNLFPCKVRFRSSILSRVADLVPIDQVLFQNWFIEIRNRYRFDEQLRICREVPVFPRAVTILASASNDSYISVTTSARREDVLIE